MVKLPADIPGMFMMLLSSVLTTVATEVAPTFPVKVILLLKMKISLYLFVDNRKLYFAVNMSPFVS